MIKDRVVIITGSSSGIGAATAKLLAARGAKVVLAARRRSELEQLVAEIRKAGGDAACQVPDATQPAENEAIVALARQTFAAWTSPSSAWTSPSSTPA